MVLVAHAPFTSPCRSVVVMGGGGGGGQEGCPYMELVACAGLV